MPPGRPRKTTSNNTTTRAQQTLAFGPHSNKVTKPSTQPLHSTKKNLTKSQTDKLSQSVSEISTPVPTPPSRSPKENSQEQSPEEEEEEEEEEEAQQRKQKSPSPSPSPALAIRRNQQQQQQSTTTTATTKSTVEEEQDEKARTIPDAQVRRYWAGKEEERIAPRVHQQGLSVNEKVLREFDLSSQFGPCIGIPRMRRWHRAQGLGLHPPIEVLAVLLKEEGNKNGKAERAFMEGLLTSRLAE